MKKLICNIVVSLLLSCVLGKYYPIINDVIVNTLYTISGIMFSVGMGMLCALNFDRVKNNNFYREIKFNLLYVRNIYLIYFLFASLFYILYYFLKEFNGVNCITYVWYLVVLFCIISIIYFVYNFVLIQKLNFELSDRYRNKV